MINNTQSANNKRIAKNTLLLYFRMMFTMAVALFTSRVILQTLGVQDYGLYQSVGGIVGFLSFINGALAVGSSRFLTYGLGKGDSEYLKDTFSTTLTIHVLLALAIAVAAETSGLWFLHNKLIVPEGRMAAAEFVLHASILTAMITMTQVPYNACVIAHEKMAVYAYVSITDAVMKLFIVYLLYVADFDKLTMYAALLLLENICVQMFYRIYCGRKFAEARWHIKLKRKILKEIGSFSAWSLLGQGTIALNNQGILIVLNIFFQPAVVAARAISLQVNNVVNQFVQNFRTAVNPQIVKRYAAGDFEGSKSLLISSTKYSYYLTLIISFPICILAYPLLHAWLGMVPEYADVFLQLVVVQSLFEVFNSSLYMAFYANGRIKENAILSPAFGLVTFPIIYILFRFGYSPISMSWIFIVKFAIEGLVVKPALMVRFVGYKWSDVIPMFRTCFIVTLAALPIPIICDRFINENTVTGFVLIGIISVTCCAVSIFFLGIDKQTRHKILVFAMNKISRK